MRRERDAKAVEDVESDGEIVEEHVGGDAVEGEEGVGSADGGRAEAGACGIVEVRGGCEAGGEGGVGD